MRHNPACLSLVMLLACAPEGESIAEEDNTSEVLEDGLSYSEDAMVLNFGEQGVEDWFAVNDTVMGGVSSGTLTFDDDTMVFEGEVSTESNGGFASVRSPQDSIDLSMYRRVLIRMKSKGQPFSIILADSPLWFDNQYKYDIVVPDDDWNTIEILFEDFQEYQLSTGYPEPTGISMAPEDTEEIVHMELMSRQFEDGEYRLEVDYIAFD
ncbi:MAG: NADH dehydrogenase [ubiquinone] 1 alpha subcomplex assembly factor 1 [Myxococcota bacterium]